MRIWSAVGGFAALLLAGCGDKDKTSPEGCTDADVIVTVTDPANGDAAVEGAVVEVDDLACAEGDPGVYTCTVPSDAEYAVYVTDARFVTYAETITIEAGACEYPVDAAMQPDIAY